MNTEITDSDHLRVEIIPDPRRYKPSKDYYDFDFIKNMESLIMAWLGGLGKELQISAAGYYKEEFNDFICSPNELAEKIKGHYSRLIGIIANHASIHMMGVRQHFFITRGLIEDLLETSVERVMPSAINYPFAAYYLHLPTRSVPNGNGDFLATIGVGYLRNGDGIAVLWVVARMTGGRAISFCLPENELFSAICDYGEYSNTNEAADIILHKNIVRIIIGVNVYINKPGTKEYKMAVERSEKVGGKQANGLWTRRMVGLKYVSARQESKGTHESPRAHFRRGHIRHLEERVVWVRPCFVGAPKAIQDSVAAQ